MNRSLPSVINKFCLLLVTIVSVIFHSSGCTMNQTQQATTPPAAYFKPAASDATTSALDANLTKYLRKQYNIKSVKYFQVNPDFSWQQVIKPVQNEMSERSIRGVQTDWHSAGIDLIEIFPQGQTAFAVAMMYAEKKGDPHSVGYYILEKQK
jgi:hypothetical protein